MAYLPLILRGNRAMPLFRAAAPFKGDILKEIEWIVSINSDRIAMPGCVESLPPAIVEFHDAGILDAVRLGFERVR